jgi:hypothetical protein
MQYPPDFPPESRSRVEAERLRAAKDFDKARENPLAREYGARRHLEAELRKYILRQFAVFVREAGKLGWQGIWQVDQVEEASLEFLRLSTIDATSSKGFDTAGRAFARDWTGNWGYIESRVQREFERSDEWRHFQETLLQVAERQAMRASDEGRKGREATGDTSRDSAQLERAGPSLNAEDVAMGTPEPPAPAAVQEPSRRSAVDAFLLKCNQCTTELPPGSKVVKKHLWLAAGHTHPRQFH